MSRDLLYVHTGAHIYNRIGHYDFATVCADIAIHFLHCFVCSLQFKCMWGSNNTFTAAEEANQSTFTNTRTDWSLDKRKELKLQAHSRINEEQPFSVVNIVFIYKKHFFNRTFITFGFFFCRTHTHWRSPFNARSYRIYIDMLSVYLSTLSRSEPPFSYRFKFCLFFL